MNKQVLIVDDSAPIHTLVKSLLAEEPVDMHSAMSATLGLTMAASIKPDLVLLDVEMPEMDGFEFCRRMKTDPESWNVPVVFLTAKSDTNQKVFGLEMGAMDYITKPFDASELVARVHASLRVQSVIRDLEDRSLLDSLTGAGNRKLFDQRLNAEVSVRARSPRPLSCTYIDIDGFRTINRCYGQSFGDDVLKGVADILRESYRPEDVICRLGADDFGVLTPDTGIDQAASLATKMKNLLARAPFPYRDAMIPITCGIGIAEAGDPFDHSALMRAIEVLCQSPKRASNGFFLERPATPKIVAEAA